MPKQCPFCGSPDLKEEDDKSKPPITFVPRPIYTKKYTCKKCRKSFSKEQMENPASVSKPQEQEEAPAEIAAAPSEEIEAAAPPARKKGMAAKLFETEASTAEAESSSEPSPEAAEPRALPSRVAKGFATLDSSSQQQAPAEKKSYMQIMKEKSLYQAQQFESTMEVEAGEAKPAPKPAAKPVAKPAGVKPPAVMKPVKPAGAARAIQKPPAKPASRPQKPQVQEFENEGEFSSPPPEISKELPELPDLPSLEGSSNEISAETPVNAEASPEMEESEAANPPPVQKPAGMKPMKAAGVKPLAGPPQKLAGVTPPASQKPAGMKPPAGIPAGMKPPAGIPAGMKPTMKPPVQKPAGMKLPAIQKPAGMRPPIKPPSQFQSFEPSTRAAPFPAVQAPEAPQGSRLDQLMAALNTVLSSLQWPQEKKDALMQELTSLPEDQQKDFLEQLGVEIPAQALAAQPVPQAPEEAPAYAMPSMPKVPESFAPVPPMKMLTKPPAKPAGMKPVKPAGMKPVKPAGIAPPVAPPRFVPAPPVMKPMKPARGARPAAVPPVLPQEEGIPSFAVEAPSKPVSSAGNLFKDIDQEITNAVGGDLDFGKLLESDLAKSEEAEVPVAAKRGKGKKGAKIAAPFEEGVPVQPEVPEVPTPPVQKGPIKLSQISTKVEKKSAAELKREEEKLKAAASSESSLVYMRLLGFEKLASGGKSYKIGDFCKTLKDIEPQVVIDFIRAVDNDMLIFYEESKGQVVVSELSGPELEIMSRQFEKWLRFGRL